MQAAHHPVIVDVRSPGEFASGHVAGSINLPLGDLPRQAGNMLAQRDAPLILCCVSGGRSALAMQWLQAQGYTQVSNGGSVGAVALRLGLPVQAGHNG
mgnify:CR=1 FL=1|jgi:phage shock protein E